VEPFGFATQAQAGVGSAVVVGWRCSGMDEILRGAQNDDATAILFVAQGYDGVDADGAAGWEVAGQQRDQDEKYRHGGEGCGIGGADAIEHAGH